MSLAAILPAAISFGANVVGGIANAASMPGRKRKFIREQKKQALAELLSRRAAELGAPTYAVDALARNRAIQNTADQNFRVDPTQFLGAVSSGAQLAGGIYDHVNEPTPPDPFEQPDQVAGDYDYSQPPPTPKSFDSFTPEATQSAVDFNRDNPLRRGTRMNLFGR